MKRHILPVLLVSCTLIVALWLVMARQSAKPFKPFDLTGADFAGVELSLPGWSVRSIAVSTNDPAEPNIAAFVVEGGNTRPPLPMGERIEVRGISLVQTNTLTPALSPEGRGSAGSRLPFTAVARLVHGYNMPMCMKIKGYTVEAIADHRPQTTDSHLPDADTPTHPYPDTLPPLPLQLWRVTSSDGERSVWVTTMIRAGEFTPTTVDICSMAFPRVDVPDDPRWIPRGFTWADLRHPVASLQVWTRARWNASRTDLLTFLRLRQPAWASEELLTFVTRSLRPAITGENEEEVLNSLITVHTQMLESLQAWRVSQLKGQ